MPEARAEHLKPIIEGILSLPNKPEKIYLARAEDRIYVGVEPAQKIRGSDAAPDNIELDVATIDENTYVELANQLNALASLQRAS